jgi:hypothetical protein
VHLSTFVFPALLLVFVLLVVGLAWAHRRDQSAMRDVAVLEDVVARVPVGLRMLPSGAWGKFMNGMRLVVRTHTIQFTMFNETVATLLSCNWYLKSDDLTMDTSTSLPGLPSRQWIVLYGVNTEEPTSFALTAGNLPMLWDRLVEAGVCPGPTATRPS